MSACAHRLAGGRHGASADGAEDGPFPARNLIVFLTFAVIVTTLVVQGLSLPVVLRFLGFASAAGPAATDGDARPA